MDGLSAAANVIAVIQIAGTIWSLCSQYLTAAKNAKPDIERLQGELSRLKNVLEVAQKLLEGPNGSRLQASQELRSALENCSSRLKGLESKLKEKLETAKRGNIVGRFRLRALKWPLESNDVDSIVQSLYEFRDTLSACLSVDQTSVVDSPLATA